MLDRLPATVPAEAKQAGNKALRVALASDYGPLDRPPVIRNDSPMAHFSMGAIRDIIVETLTAPGGMAGCIISETAAVAATEGCV